MYNLQPQSEADILEQFTAFSVRQPLRRESHEPRFPKILKKLFGSPFVIECGQCQHLARDSGRQTADIESPPRLAAARSLTSTSMRERIGT